MLLHHSFLLFIFRETSSAPSGAGAALDAVLPSCDAALAGDAFTNFHLFRLIYQQREQVQHPRRTRATSVSRLSNAEVRAVLSFLLKCERKDDDALTR
jgi:hypothetical protein